MKKLTNLAWLMLLALIITSCSDNESEGPQPDPIRDEDKQLPARWADVTLRTIQNAFPGSPTYTSRSLGYVGLTMFETVVHGSPVHRSVADQLNGMPSLPQPENETYNWSIALNAGQAYMLRKLYPHSQALNEVDALEQSILSEESLHTPDDVITRSAQLGRAIAEAIFEWSKTDGGHEGYLFNFDPEYQFPVGNGYWKAPFIGQSPSPWPLHPYWGNNRTFIAANLQLPVPDKVKYSRDHSSDYYKYFYEVYYKRRRLTDDEKRIAAWWADDPTQTASPPGHSYNLATIVITYNNADVFTAAEVYAKVGMAVADAFISCWRCKYTYHSERPAPYIIANIDKRYRQFWPEPPFPAFSSGHATQSAAAAIAMMSVFENEGQFVDNTYATRKPDFEGIRYRSRVYNSIWETAVECAHSRFLGGIHTTMDNEAGTAQGKVVGENVNALMWNK